MLTIITNLEALKMTTKAEARHIDNARVRTNNASGVRGVYYDKARGLWSAQITSKKKTKSLGRFSRFEDAVKARADAEAVYHKDFSALKGVLHEEC